MAAGDDAALRQMTMDAVRRFGHMPGRGRGLSSWSSYNTLQKLSPDSLVLRLAQALMRGSDDRAPRAEPLAMARRGSTGRAASSAASRPTCAAASRRRSRPTTSRRRPCGRRWTRSTSCQRDAATSTTCVARSTRWRGGSPRGWPRSSTTGGAGRSTSGARSGPRWRPVACPSRRTTGRAARTAPSWSCCATSAAPWRASRRSPCCSSTRCASSSARCVPSPSSTTSTRSPTSSCRAPTRSRRWRGSRSRRGTRRCGDAPTTAGRCGGSRSSTATRSGRSRRCWSSGTPAPTTPIPGSTPCARWWAPRGTRGGSTPSTAASGTPGTPPRRSTPPCVRMVECRNLTQLSEFVHDLV